MSFPCHARCVFTSQCTQHVASTHRAQYVVILLPCDCLLSLLWCPTRPWSSRLNSDCGPWSKTWSRQLGHLMFRYACGLPGVWHRISWVSQSLLLLHPSAMMWHALHAVAPFVTTGHARASWLLKSVLPACTLPSFEPFLLVAHAGPGCIAPSCFGSRTA